MIGVNSITWYMNIWGLFFFNDLWYIHQPLRLPYVIKVIVSLISHICLLYESISKDDILQDCTFYFEMNTSSSKPILRISISS